ncbi:MAG: hypothetical protein SNJ77_13095 [Cytophagales bacterium]
MLETESNTNLERSIILRVVIGTLLAISLYIFTATFIKYDLEVIIQSSISIGVFGVFGWVVYKSKNFERCKNVFLCVCILSNFASFYFLGGLFGIVALDIVNTFLMICFLSEISKRAYFLFFQILLVVTCGVIQMTDLLPIVDNSEGYPNWVNLSHILVRIGLSVNLGLTLKNAYHSQYISSKDLVSKVNQLNDDLAEQKEDLLSAQEQLTSNNNNLENMVLERTKTLEQQNEMLLTYAYINSHVFRAPICRIKGLKQLIEMTDQANQKDLYLKLIADEIASMDSVVSEIALMLNDSNPEFLDELKNKAKKIGYQSNS